jgi:NADPH:quinone reductase-like Zn-dependent oxidoreductase
MKAIVQDTYGPADVLEVRDIAPPSIGEEDVLVRVAAAGVDRGAWHFMTGQPYLMRILGFGFRAPKIPVPGTNVAGRVEAVGKNVTRFHVGDEVYGTCRGAFAEYARASQDKLASKPNSLTFEQAAVVPYAGFAAWQAVHDRGRVEAGQQVLVVGGSGAVGSFAVQLAKVSGAEVTAVCSTRNHLAAASYSAPRRRSSGQPSLEWPVHLAHRSPCRHPNGHRSCAQYTSHPGALGSSTSHA